jgi:sugar/nucleoside kinase (ribokinase family)
MGGHVCVLGDLALDYYLQLPRHGPQDEKITAERALRLPGGTGANAAVTARVLGSDVTLHSAVGDDPQGRWLAQEMAARGVGTQGIRVFPGTSTRATILLAEGSRTVIVDRGVADRLADLDPPLTTGTDVVYLTGSGMAIRRLAGAGLAGYIVAGIESWMAGEPGLAAALRGGQLVITNTAGWNSFRGQLAAGVPVIETQGARGVTIHHGPGPAEQVPALPAAAVDATGAGDCFAGALCHYLAAGLDLAAACRLAVAAAALSTRALGAQGALPTDAQVRAAAARPGRSHSEIAGMT